MHYIKLKYQYRDYLMHMQYHFVTRCSINNIKNIKPCIFFSPGATSRPRTNHIFMASCFPISVIHKKIVPPVKCKTDWVIKAF